MANLATEVKLYGRWSFEDVEVKDISLEDISLVYSYPDDEPYAVLVTVTVQMPPDGASVTAGVTVDDRLEAVVGTVQARAKTLVDLVEAARFYFTPDDELEWDEKAVNKFLKPKTVMPMHYGTFGLLKGTPDQLKTHLSGMGDTTEIVVMQPGDEKTFGK